MPIPTSDIRDYQHDLLNLLHRYGTPEDWWAANSAIENLIDRLADRNAELNDRCRDCLNERPARVRYSGNILDYSRRFSILKILKNQSGYRAGVDQLLPALHERGYAVSRDPLEVDLRWLAEVAHAVVERISGIGMIVILTGMGLDIVEDRLRIPGIRRPHPSEVNTTL